MSELVVVDTTVWSNFAVARHPRLVVEVYPQGKSPRAVLDEIEEGRRLGYFPEVDLAWIPEVALDQKERDQARELAQALDRGEAECLAVAHNRQAGLLTDDRPARDRARALGITPSGTLGVLLRVVSLGRLSLEEADELLAQMIQARFHSPVSSLRELL